MATLKARLLSKLTAYRQISERYCSWELAME